MSDDGTIAGFARSYGAVAARRPLSILVAALCVTAVAGWLGTGLKVRSQLEDLFPDDTPAVKEARRARAILPSVNRMIVVFGSPDREANRQIATEFCAKAAKFKEIASVECHRDVEFFRRNAALFLTEADLLKIEDKVSARIREATSSEMLGGGFADIDTKVAGDDAEDDEFGDEDEEDQEDEEDEEDEFSTPAQSATPTASADANRGENAEETAEKTAEEGAAKPKSWAVPTDAEIQEKVGANADLREWTESKDGGILGVKLFPRVDAGDVDAASALVAKVTALVESLEPTRRHADMQFVVKGDYSRVSAHVKTIRKGLATTTAIALIGIILLQLLAFRRLRALVVLFLPMLVGIALTTGFAAVTIGYLNIITAFIFAILFGLGNDFAVYTLSRYLEVRARGVGVADALAEAMPELWSALGTAAATTAGSFFALTLFDFRGFSQFGLIAGTGVLLTLAATLLLFPPLVLALHRLWPEGEVSARRAEGLAGLSVLVRPGVARVVVAVIIALAIAGGWLAQGLDFNTDFRRLRTVAKPTAKDAPPPKLTAEEQTEKDKARLANRYDHRAVKRNVTPILLVADSMEHAKIIHDQLDSRDDATRIDSFLSIHTFVPDDQAPKAAIAARIRQKIEAKRSSLTGEDAIEADRAMTRLAAKPFAAADLPDFIRKRFEDVDGKLGRFLLLSPNGNLANARSVREVIDQVGTFNVGERTYRSTASYFMLAEADGVVREEGPWAILAAALAVLLITGLHFRAWRPVAFAFVPLVVAFVAFLGVAKLANLELNLFSVTVLPSVFGIGIDGTVHVVHRAWQARSRAELRTALSTVFAAAWLAALTTVVGFAALLFQDNRGVQTLASMAVWGIAVVCVLANLLSGALLALSPRFSESDDSEDKAG